MNEAIFWGIIDILTTMLSCTLYFWFIGKIAGGKKNIISVALAYAAFFILVTALRYVAIAPLFKYLFVLGVCDLFILLGYRISIKNLLIGNLCDMVFSLISEMLIVGILMGLNGYSIIEIIGGRGVVNVQAFLISKLVYFVLLVFVVRKMNPRAVRLNGKDMLLLIVQTIAYTVIMYAIIEITILYNRRDLYIVLVALSAAALVCYFISYLLTCSRAKDREIKEEYIKRQAYTEQQFKYYRRKEESGVSVQKLAHDMKHHILALQDMIKKSESVKAQNYLNKMEDILEENKRYFDTGCSIMDVILSEKVARAEQWGIKVNLLYEPECLREYEPVYLCSIMGNALDNAMRAVSKMEGGEKWIDIKIRLDKEKKVFIMVNNPYSGKLRKENGRYLTTKRDRKHHGLGLKCIEDAVNSFNGEMSILDEDNVFSLMIMI